jgi:tellurite resistance protein TerC
VKWAKGCLGGRMVDKYHGSAIWIYVEGILRITPMLLVIVVIELTDVAFCIDGVSTIFMVDHVHVSTLFLGDIVAACLVRALYPQLAGTVELFPDLNYSVACVLVLVGVDMCSGVFGHDFPPGFLALAMAVLFTLGMASSVMRGVCRKEEAAAAEETKALLGDSKYGATK